MAYLLLVLTVLFWAGNFVTARAIHVQAEPVTLALMRWSLAFLIILPWALPRLWRDRKVLVRHFPILLLLSILGVASFNTLVYLGVQTTTATNATLMQSAVPIVILLISALFLREKVQPRQWLGVMMSLLGVAVLITRADIDMLRTLSFNPGDIWLFASVLSWSTYSVALRWRPKELDGFTLFAFNVLIGVLILLPIAFWEQGGDIPHMRWSASLGMAVIYMAIFPSILSYLFWNRGVAELGAPRAGLFIHLMPLFGLLLSVIFLGEQLHAYHLLGIVLIFSGIYLATVSQTLGALRARQQQTTE